MYYSDSEDSDEDVQEFQLGRFCAEKAGIAHELRRESLFHRSDALAPIHIR